MNWQNITNCKSLRLNICHCDVTVRRLVVADLSVFAAVVHNSNVTTPVLRLCRKRGQNETRRETTTPRRCAASGILKPKNPQKQKKDELMKQVNSTRNSESKSLALPNQVTHQKTGRLVRVQPAAALPACSPALLAHWLPGSGESSRPSAEEGHSMHVNIHYRVVSSAGSMFSRGGLRLQGVQTLVLQDPLKS